MLTLRATLSIRALAPRVDFWCGATWLTSGGGKMAGLSAVPEEMTAIAIATPGGPEALVAQRRPVPTPGEGEVLIKVAAAGVNRPDVLQRQGKYPPPPGASDVPGLEIAGTIVAAGSGADKLVGQKVCALLAGGGYAEYAVAPAGQCLPVPDDYDLAEAAALPETLFTVWTNLFERAYAMGGDTVLVHGGTSGIGTMAIRLCTLFDVRVIVTCGSDEKCAQAKAWGADHAINYRTQDYVAEVKRITDGQGVQAVLDMVGGDYVPRNLECLAEDGHLHPRDHAAAPNHHRLDPARPLGRVQEPGRRRTDAQRLALRGRRQAAPGDGPALRPDGRGQSTCPHGRRRSFREDRAGGLRRQSTVAETVGR